MVRNGDGKGNKPPRALTAERASQRAPTPGAGDASDPHAASRRLTPAGAERQSRGPRGHPRPRRATGTHRPRHSGCSADPGLPLRTGARDLLRRSPRPAAGDGGSGGRCRAAGESRRERRETDARRRRDAFPSALPSPEPARPPQAPAAARRHSPLRRPPRDPRGGGAAALSGRGSREAPSLWRPRPARGGAGRAGAGRPRAVPGALPAAGAGPLGPGPREALEPSCAGSSPVFFWLLFWFVFLFPRCVRRIPHGARRGAATHLGPLWLIRGTSALLPRPVSPGREQRCCAHRQLQAPAPLWARSGIHRPAFNPAL